MSDRNWKFLHEIQGHYCGICDVEVCMLQSCPMDSMHYDRCATTVCEYYKNSDVESKISWNGKDDDFRICGACKNKSKRVVGFADGETSSHFLFDCDSSLCRMKLLRDEKANERKLNHEHVQKTNLQNGVDVDVLRELCLKQHITMFEMARFLNVSVVEYSNFISCKQCMPADVYLEAVKLLTKE